jgi:hypothetical protein
VLLLTLTKLRTDPTELVPGRSANESEALFILHLSHVKIAVGFFEWLG